MKIAVVLRGLPRYEPFDLAKKLLDALVLKRFDAETVVEDGVIRVITKKHEFRLIMQIPTLSEHTDIKKTTSWKSVFVGKILSSKECDKIINGYNPDYAVCNTFVPAFDAAVHYQKKHHGEIISTDDKYRTLYLFNDICQHVNYLHSKQALIEYAIKSDWYPDLILNTRYDLIHFFESHSYIDDWEEYLSLRPQGAHSPMQYEFNIGSQSVYPKRMECYGNKIWISDWSFFETWSKQDFLRQKNYNVAQAAIDFVDSDLFHMYTTTSNQNSHFYWHCLFKDYIIQSTPDFGAIQHFSVLVRNMDRWSHKALLETNDPIALKARMRKISQDNPVVLSRPQAKPPQNIVEERWKFYSTAAKEFNDENRSIT